MRKFLLSAALTSTALLAGQSASAQTDATPEGIAFQDQMPAMTLTKSMFLNMEASAQSGVPIERGDGAFPAGERIVIYSKFAHVGRINPGAVEGYMDLAVHIRIVNASGAVIVDQAVARPDLERVDYPYEGGVPDAYFDSFKLTILSLSTPGTYAITLTFTDMVRPASQTDPIVVTLNALVE